jgi:hypothetical protein
MTEFASCDWDENKKLIKNQDILVFHDPKDSTVSIEHSRYFEKEIRQIKLVEHSKGHGICKELISIKTISSFLKD